MFTTDPAVESFRTSSRRLVMIKGILAISIPLSRPLRVLKLKAVTEELFKPSVEEKQPKPTQSEDAISGNAHQGKVIGDRTVLEETEETGSESGNGQDTLTQDNNSPPDSPELEPRPKRQRHPPTVLTYNTLGNPTYETQAAVHVIAANSVSGSQLPQCGTPHLHWRTGLPTVQQFQLPS